MAIALLAGCGSGVGGLQKNLEAMHARGDYALAAQFLDEPDTLRTYEANRPDGRDVVLWDLERGAVALANDNCEQAIKVFNHAEERTRYNYERSSGEILSTWVFNDTTPPYLASPYEDQYINVMKMLAYLRLGQVEGKATAEARRFADKARYLREQYGRYYKTVSDETRSRFAKDQGEARFDDDRLRKYATAGPPADFIESPLGAYLSAIAFLKTPGEAEAQRGAAQRLLDSLRQQGPLVGDADPKNFADLPDAAPSSVNTLVVALSGRGPVKDKEEFGPIFLWYTTIHIVLPRLVPLRSSINGAYLELSDGTRHDLFLVEDMSRVAIENFERQMPTIYQRTMLRVFAKAAAVGVATVATDASTRGNRDRGGAAVAQLGVRALGFLYMWLSEDADTRGWVFLPAQARAAHLKLPVGTQRVRVVYTTRSGSTIPQAWREIQIAPGKPGDAGGGSGLTTIISHNPN